MNAELFQEILKIADIYAVILDSSLSIKFLSENFRKGDYIGSPEEERSLAGIGISQKIIELTCEKREFENVESFMNNKWISWTLKISGNEMILTGKDISSEKQIKDKLYNQISLEENILIFAKNFITLPVSLLNDHIYFAIKIISEQINSDISYLLKIDEDDFLFWCARNSLDRKELIFSETRQLIEKLNIVEEKEALFQKLEEPNSLGVNTKLVLPLIYNGAVFAYLCFESVKRETGWNDIIINKLKLFSAIIISALKRFESEKEIKKAFNREIDLNEMKSRFISTTSHEFRTPLTAVLSSTEVLEMLLENPNPEISKRHIQNIKESVTFLNGLIEDVLTVTKVDSGKLVFYPEEFDFKDFCDALYQEFFLSAENVKIFDYKYAAKNRRYKLDKKLLRNVISNLLSNAVKYSGKGSIINFWIEEKDAKIIITIIDNGIGIPKKDQNSLFEPFFRAGNIENIQGHGLGLSIVKKAVDLQNGEIEFNSEENKGTKFIVKIPVN